MHEVFPLAELQAKLDKPITVTRKGKKDLPELIRTNPNIGGLTLSVWNRVIEVEKLDFEPNVVAPHIKNGQAKRTLLPFVTKVLKQEVVKDIFVTACRVEDAELSNPVIAKLEIAHVFPNDLHLADVFFQNPYEPIPERLKRYQFAEFKGFGLLELTLERVEAEARRLGCDHITLTCAGSDLVPLFRKYGFKLETGRLGSAARAMDKKLKA